MAMPTSTFSPHPATPRTLRAGASRPHLLRLARAAGEAPVEVAVAPTEQREPEGGAPAPAPFPAFRDARWVNGTWDIAKFDRGGAVDWDAEARRRKWLQDYPEATNTDEAVVFDTSIIPWWAWMKRFHVPEAEKLNGRAAMFGFFMAYFVDSLTGAGLVDQMGNFFCKTLLFVAVSGVLLIRKNEDLDNLKKIIDETTFYDKQWQATWKDDTTTGGPKN